MIDEVYTVAGQLGIVLVFGMIGAALSWRNFCWRPFVVALALYVVYDALLTRGFFLVPNLPAESSWNWLGKAMSFVAMLVVASRPAFGFRKVGLSFEHRPGILSPVLVFAGLLACFAYLALSDTSGNADIETMAFQWTMPSLDDELFYRGVLLLVMNDAFTRRVEIFGAPVGYGGLLTSLLFGLAHGFGYSQGSFHFDLNMFVVTGLPSLILLWLRERTGSLLLPMLAHSASNGLFTVL